MGRLFSRLHRARAWMTVHHLEIQLQGQIDALAECDNPDLKLAISTAYRRTSHDLEQAQQRYREVLPLRHRIPRPA